MVIHETRTSENTYEVYVVYYLYDVFDWNKNNTTPVFGLISQQDIWELQYGGRGKGYMVTGQTSCYYQWTAGETFNGENL